MKTRSQGQWLRSRKLPNSSFPLSLSPTLPAFLSAPRPTMPPGGTVRVPPTCCLLPKHQPVSASHSIGPEFLLSLCLLLEVPRKKVLQGRL